MNKHNNKYHGDDGVAAIPTSLHKAPARLQQDRSRFLLKEISSERSFHAAEEDRVRSEVSVAINPAPDSHNVRLLMDENQEEHIIKCVCGSDGDDGNTILCDTCDTWQHTGCYYVDEYGKVLGMHVLEGIQHFCVDCKPRPLDAKGARARYEPAVAHAVTQPSVKYRLTDYQMQLMIIEQQRKKRLLLNSRTHLNGRPPT